MSEKLKTAARIILPLWLVIKLIGAAVTYLTMTAADLTFLHPALELALRALVFTKDASLGLGLYIGMIVLLAVGFPAGFLVVPDDRGRNIAGFCAYAAVTLTDIVSACLLGLGDGMMLLSLLLHLVMLAALLFWARRTIFMKKDEKTVDKTRSL